MFDIIIRNGQIVDGAKTPRYPADVGVQGDRITAIGNLEKAPCRLAIDAAGNAVAPGFVDVHNHSDGWLLKTPHLKPKTLQGFTTEILMVDGVSYAPVNTHTARQWLFYLRALDGLRVDEYRGWESLADFMRQIHGNNVQNAAMHVPYGNIRSMVCGFGRRAVDDFQMRQIQYEIRHGMDQGAVGLSTGLDYVAQCFATTDELVGACSAVAPVGGLYVTHVRYKRGLMPALQEAVEIGRRAGVPLHISHLKVQPPHTAEQVFDYLDNVARREVDLSFDVYPYQPGSTLLSYLLPYEIWTDGPLAALGKLHDPQVRGRFRDGMKAYRLDLDHIRIAWVAGKDSARHQGKTLRQYVDETGLPAEEALYDLLIEERLAVLCVMDEGEDALVHPFLKHELGMLGTDGIYFPDGVVHPRVYGSAGRLLGPCVRDLKLFSLEEAVYKLSGFPAGRFGLKDRGAVRQGNFADLVVFDPQIISDRATYDDPHQPAVGILEVLVNGVAIVRGGRPVDELPSPLPGRFLRRER